MASPSWEVPTPKATLVLRCPLHVHMRVVWPYPPAGVVPAFVAGTTICCDGAPHPNCGKRCKPFLFGCSVGCWSQFTLYIT